MHCLAVCELSRPLDPAEEGALATILGLAAYDVRIRLGGVLPRIAAQTEDADAAVELADRIRARGHGAIVFAKNEATPLSKMTPLRRFSLEGDRLFANDAQPPGRPLGDLVALVHAALNVRVERTTRETVPAISANGTPATQEVERTSSEQTVDQVVVLCWREGTPWLLRPSEARYLGLGPLFKPTTHENFRTTIEWLRARAPNAVYDGRFLTRHLLPQTTLTARDHDAVSPLASDRGAEQILHALGAWLARGRGGPYR